MNTVTNVEGLRAALQEHVVAIDFTKKDGSKRHLVGTTQPAYLERAENLTAEQIATRASSEHDSGDLVKAWDTENGGWRSFHYDQVISSQVTA